MRTIGPATPYCNAIGPSCGKAPVVVVTSAVMNGGKLVYINDLMCVDHGREYAEKMLAGDTKVARIEPKERPS